MLNAYVYIELTYVCLLSRVYTHVHARNVSLCIMNVRYMCIMYIMPNVYCIVYILYCIVYIYHVYQFV